MFVKHCENIAGKHLIKSHFWEKPEKKKSNNEIYKIKILAKNQDQYHHPNVKNRLFRKTF